MYIMYYSICIVTAPRFVVLSRSDGASCCFALVCYCSVHFIRWALKAKRLDEIRSFEANIVGTDPDIYAQVANDHHV